MNKKLKLSNMGYPETINNNLNDKKVAELRQICKDLDLESKGKKAILINRILSSEITKQQLDKVFTELIPLKDKFTDITDISSFKSIMEKIYDIFVIWDKYKVTQKDYIEQTNTYLDNAVYGLKDAKNQIKRIIGQWVNGKNLGYYSLEESFG